MNAVLTGDDLLGGYTAYTSAVELDVTDGGAQAPAFSPAASPLVPILLRATLITARSSQNCAIAIARTTGGIARTIEIVC